MDSQGIAGRTEGAARRVIRRLPLRRALVVTAATLIVMVCLASLREIMADRELRMAESEQQLDKLGMLFAEQAGRTIESVDLVIEMSLEALADSAAESTHSGESVAQLLRRHLVGVRQLSALMTVDAKGTVT